MSCVSCEVESGVARITLNRPHRLNAINDALVADLHTALRRAHADETVRVLLLAGAGRAFCAGDDLKEYEHHARSLVEARRYLSALQEVTRAIVFGDKPVVCAVRGYAVGGGFEWLLNCDLVVMSENTRCFFPEIGLGFMVTGGVSTLLPRLVGLQRARSMMLFGEHVDAAEAQRLGLVHEVVADTDLETAALALAQRVANLPAHSVAALKRVLNRAVGMDLDGVLALEVEAVAQCFVDPATPALVAAAAPRRGDADGARERS